MAQYLLRFCKHNPFMVQRAIPACCLVLLCHKWVSITFKWAWYTDVIRIFLSLIMSRRITHRSVLIVKQTYFCCNSWWFIDMYLKAINHGYLIITNHNFSQITKKFRLMIHSHKSSWATRVADEGLGVRFKCKEFCFYFMRPGNLI